MRTVGQWCAAIVACAVLASVGGCTGGSAGQPAVHRPVGTAPSPTRARTGVSSAARASSPAATATTRNSTPSGAPHSLPGVPLPLRLRTGSAAQVITAAAPSTSSTQGVVQAWRKVPGGWQLHTDPCVRAAGRSRYGIALCADDARRLVDQRARPALQHPAALLGELPLHPRRPERAPVLHGAVLPVCRRDRLQHPQLADRCGAGCGQRVLPARHGRRAYARLHLDRAAAARQVAAVAASG
jgi:hypothetical protein